jgi:phosphoglycolate phosphatase-like HAD superfamily hydrolase
MAPPRPFAVVDIDGVVADVRHRLHHLDRRPKAWDAFFGEAVNDPLLDEGDAVAHQLAEGHDLVWLTGRPERCRRDTMRWLRDQGLPDGRLLMRRAGDRRPARTVKVEALRRLSRERPVSVLVDDDTAVVSAARRAGFTVLHADWMTVSDRGRLQAAQEREGRT